MNFFPMNLVPENGGVVPSLPSIIVSCDRDVAWFGRTQVGFPAHIAAQTVSGSSYVSEGALYPDSNPKIRFYAGSAPIRSYYMPIDPTSPGTIGIFHGLFTPSGVDSPCNTFALMSYAINGEQKALISVFEILPGGHPNGSVNSTLAVSIPQGSSLISHQSSGRISSGINAYLDTGSTE